VRIVSFTTASAIVVITPLHAQIDTMSTGQPSPLFSSHEVLELTIEAPFETVFKERGQESTDHPALLRYWAADGSRDSVPIEVKTRGKFRLQRSTCNFPPIRVDFPRGDVENTIFQGQNHLKLVTHCQNGRDEYEQQVILEYLVYRMLHVLTERTALTRLAHITYVDTDDDDLDSLTRYAFFIEDEEMVAARNGVSLLEVPQVSPWNYDQRQLILIDVFQYMIGNTDWDAYSKSEDQERCCHNQWVIGEPAGPVYPVPYDFDWSGLVDRRYAKPDPSLRIRDVRERQFRGVCRAREDIEAVLPLFVEKQAEIYDLFRNQPLLEERYVERSLDFLDDFYEIINDPKKVESRMLRDCRHVRPANGASP
jgi:hypothetical protein